MNENQGHSDLVDIDTVDIDPDLPQDQRIVEFIRQIKNPYYFRCGKYRIRSHFRKNGPSFEDILIGMRTDF